MTSKAQLTKEVGGGKKKKESRKERRKEGRKNGRKEGSPKTNLNMSS
jgi:hypothetical protein